MANITYLNKDKTAALGSGPRTWRDEDANEVKNVVNNFRAHLVNGKVPVGQLPDEAIKIGFATDYDGTGIADGYVLYWDQTTGKFRVKAETGGAADVDIDGNQDVFLFNKNQVGGAITLLLGLNDQEPSFILSAPTTAAGTPFFRKITTVLESLPELEQFNVAYARGGIALSDIDFYQDGTVTEKGLSLPVMRVNTDVINNLSGNLIIVPDIAGLQTVVRGNNRFVAYVREEGRSGLFDYVQEGIFSGTPDYGLSFPAQDGGYWVRRFSGVVNALWYAKGDGVTNDTEAIQKAVDSGFNVVFPKKSFLISGSVILPDNIEVFSNEGGEILCGTTGGDYIGTFFTGNNNKIYGLHFIGNGVSTNVTATGTHAPAAAIRGTEIDTVQIHHCTFYDFVISQIDDAVVGFTNSRGITITENRWMSSNVGGKDINVAYRVGDCIISNNYSTSDSDAFCFISTVTSGTLPNSLIRDTCHHIIVGNIHMKNNGQGTTNVGRHGIVVHYNGGDSHLICSNNVITGAYRHGIYLRGANTVGNSTGPSIISNNIIRFCGGGLNEVNYFGYNSGIKLESTDGLIVSGNTIEDSGFYYDGTKRPYKAAGMDVIRVSRNTIISDNIINRVTGHGIAVYPTVLVQTGDRNIEKFVIKDNTILFPEVTGIIVFNNTSAGNTGLSASISIRGNTIQASDAGANLIAIDFNDSKATSLDVEGNTLIGLISVTQRGIAYTYRSNVRINIIKNKFIDLTSGIESRSFGTAGIDAGLAYTGHRIIGDRVRVKTNTFIDCTASVTVRNLTSGLLNVIENDNIFLGTTPIPNNSIGSNFNRLVFGSVKVGTSTVNTFELRLTAPPNISEQYYVGDRVINYFGSPDQPIGWKCVVSGTTGVIWTPFWDLQPAEAQSNSTATDVPGLVSDFNALLSKMRTSGLLDT